MSKNFELKSDDILLEGIKPTTDSIFINPTSDTEVINIINDMNNKKSAGVDQIPIEIIKQISSLISKPLTHLINKSIEIGIFPDHFKKAEIIPMYKSAPKDRTTNY